jgi:hypothetical protein
MPLVLESLLFPHAWVRAVSCRVVALYVRMREVTLPPPSPPTDFEVLRERNGLYQLGRRLCIYLNQPALPETMLRAAIPAAVFTVRAMYRNPDLMAAAKALPRNGARRKRAKAAEGSPEEGTEGQVEAFEQDQRDLDESSSGISSGTAGLGLGLVLGSGAAWMMQRLRGIGTDSRGTRRSAVMKVRHLRHHRKSNRV